jgi:hypothetical protein
MVGLTERKELRVYLDQEGIVVMSGGLFGA